MLTPHPEINEVLLTVSHGLQNILAQNLVGLYLFGSLSYGAFNPDSSDIDLVAILKKPLNQQELQQARQLHEAIQRKYPKWKDRIECSYTPLEMLKNTLPPNDPRPYFGGGIFMLKLPMVMNGLSIIIYCINTALP